MESHVPGLSARASIDIRATLEQPFDKGPVPTIGGSHHHGIGTSDSWIAFDDALEGLEIAQPGVFLRSG